MIVTVVHNSDVFVSYLILVFRCDWFAGIWKQVFVFQRKDYSALTKFLPPKFEYVISVRLSPVQMTLYEKYLEVNNMSGDIRSKGARLFADYQALMRIWTHPWVLKLDEIRQENKV